MNPTDERNLEFIKRIHHDMYFCARPDDYHTCYAAIFRDWKDTKTWKELEEIGNLDYEFKFDKLYTQKTFFEECGKYIELEKEDTYMSLNSFYIGKKQEVNIRHLNGFLLDFDFYKKEKYKHLTPEEFYQNVLKDELPFQPSAVVNSGRGIYVFYLFRHASKVLIPLYRAIYKALYERLKSFGMDSKAMNTTQIFRMPGTMNTKSLVPVSIIEEYETNYEMFDFCSLLQYSLEEVSEYKKMKKKKRMEYEQLHLNGINVKSENRKRVLKTEKVVRDIRKLIELRNGQCDGRREYILFSVLEKCIWAGIERNEAITVALDINSMFTHPMSFNEVSKQCMPPKRGYMYTTGKVKLIQNLEITEEEMKDMKFLKSALYMTKQKQKQRNKDILLNRTKGQAEIYKRRKQVARWIIEGEYSRLEKLYVEKYKSSIKTLKRDIQYMYTHLSEFKELQNHMWHKQFKYLKLSVKLTKRGLKSFIYRLVDSHVITNDTPLTSSG